VALVGLILLVLLVGLVYQFVATRIAYRNYPASGEMVSVSGHDMQLYCTGKARGGPTVVMDSGLGGGLLDWQTVQPKVVEFARVCSCDRSGIGWSESGTEPRTSPRIVKELHALLSDAGEEAPTCSLATPSGTPTYSSTPQSTRRRWPGWCWSTRRSTNASSTRTSETPSPRRLRPPW
jgi:hypothetical protein